jgi:archaemetzincin
MRFVPPDREARLQALGATGDLPPQLRRAFDFDADCLPLATPGPADWLALHPEIGQTFADFADRFRSPDASRARIYLQPLDDILTRATRCIDQMAVFASAFFVREVTILPPLALPRDAIRTRPSRDSHDRQCYAIDILRQLSGIQLPDALCVVGVTAHDLYPDVFVRFAFGEASAVHRVCVCSIARFGEPYCEEANVHGPAERLRRCCRLLAHEVGHILGLEHCTYYRCLMNGSANMQESDRRPLHLCPVDLRKLHAALSFNMVDRYSRLVRFYGASQFDDEGLWALRRMRRLVDGWPSDTQDASRTLVV